MRFHLIKLTLCGSLALLLTGCASQRSTDVTHFQTGESVVLVGQEPANLIFGYTLTGPVDVRSTYRNGLTNTVHYEQGRDFVLTGDGAIRRTADSRIPDFSKNMLYGKDDFDHSKFPGFGNGPFFVYVDYQHREAWEPPVAKKVISAIKLPETRKKLRKGQSLRIITFGDSITAGGDASEPGLIFWARWADALRAKYPQAHIETINGATGGDSTIQGLQRLQAKVLSQKPDLVLIGFGMNDHNREGYGVRWETFAENLRNMIDQIRRQTDAEIILFSAFPPNPKWHYGSHNMEAYATATKEAAFERDCGYADVYALWQMLSARKKPEDLLGNNINHPNDFGHWIYFEAFQGIGL